ncbi:MAG: 2-amino-4-hydroxy-6-hydroxymethyldihydropteridine pyrophosphokinase [Cycloclasticus sp. symbiont of Poecilosclerida sp. N]|nr:MAG: 2-amino-4-hydroxy-6-hydroxymethyldihydropteridine pyrophosphokinase [Cycloclasticus sp. symbiont of Poecilosclerida sp. N]
MPASVFIALGSNLSGPVGQVSQAINELKVLENSRFIAASSLYKTTPMGPQDQPAYINAVVNIQTTQKPLELLHSLQAIENSHDRTRDTGRWGARTLDLDILLYGIERSNTSELTLPHPGLQHRGFVLYPLYEIEPNLNVPHLASIKQLLDQLNEAMPPIISTKNLEI